MFSLLIPQQLDTKHSHIDPLALSDLLAAIQMSDESAFASLLRLYGNTIFSQAMAYVKNVEQAEELTQDIFMRVWRQREKLHEVDHFENWLFILARNLVFDSFKKKVSQALVATIPNDLTENITPDLTTEARDAYQLLLKGIASLPEKRRQVFKMSRLEGMSHEEIAQTLGIHKVTVAQYIVKSLSFLKAYLEKHGTDTILIIILMRGWTDV